MYQQKLQAGLNIHEGLTAQKQIDEIVRPRVKPQVDNYVLADNTLCVGWSKTSYSKDKSW